MQCQTATDGSFQGLHLRCGASALLHPLKCQKKDPSKGSPLLLPYSDSSSEVPPVPLPSSTLEHVTIPQQEKECLTFLDSCFLKPCSFWHHNPSLTGTKHKLLLSTLTQKPLIQLLIVTYSSLQLTSTVFKCSNAQKQNFSPGSTLPVCFLQLPA